MKSLLFTLSIISSPLWASHNHDWREDFTAYLSVTYDLPLLSNKSVRPSKITKKMVDMDFFQEKLITLTSTEDRQSKGNLDTTRDFLKNEYEKLGMEVSFQPFGGGINFIAEKKGILFPEKVLILSSHIDSVRCKGANDNGTGTIGLLTIARELSKKNFSHTVRILGFDQEEVGLRGSDAYVSTLREKQNIIGNINFEMMGVNSRQDGHFHVIDCKKKTSIPLSQKILSSINELNLPLTIVKACTDRSDHASFWRHQIPAVVISENFFGGDADPCYHKKCDIIDQRLDYSYMKNILTAVLDATTKILDELNP